MPFWIYPGSRNPEVIQLAASEPASRTAQTDAQSKCSGSGHPNAIGLLAMKVGRRFEDTTSA